MLHLRDNEFTSLPNEIFHELETLEELYLYGQDYRIPLNTLNSNTFENNTSLRVINLRNTSIKSLPEVVFNNVVATATINLENNNLNNSTLEHLAVYKQDNPNITWTAPSINGLRLFYDEHSIQYNTQLQLDYTTTPSGAYPPSSVSWETSSSNIFTVSNGLITPVGNGNATVTVRSEDNSNHSDTATISINIEITDISLNTQSLTFTSDVTQNLSVSFTPNIIDSVEWLSSSSNIASVSSSREVTASNNGTAIITVRLVSDNSIAATASVTVSKQN